MWKCKVCGREFEKTNQSHSCGKPEKTIDAYIASQPESIQPLLNQVRDTLRAVLPGAEERISWGMPTYWNKHNIIHFASHKKHLGLYPGEKAIEHFSERLQEYKTSKGAVQFLYNVPMPLELIREIAKWCYDTGKSH